MGFSKLSIAIPTFQRCEILLSTVSLMAEMCNEISVPIVIIDNGSTDGTSASIEKLQKKYNNIRLHTFETNDGFLSSFSRIFECVETEYVMVLSDEDAVDCGALEDVLGVLERYNLGFFSPQALQGNKIYRGRQRSRRINPEDFVNSSFYVSGLIFRKDLSRMYMKHIVRDLGELPVVKIYPQVVLAACIQADEDSRWIASPVCSLRETPAESSITEELGAPYFLLDSRVRQQISWMKFIEWLRIDTNSSDNARMRKVRQMEQGIVNQFFPILLNAAAQHSNELGISLRASTWRWVGNQFFRFPKKIIRHVL